MSRTSKLKRGALIYTRTPDDVLEKAQAEHTAGASQKSVCENKQGMTIRKFKDNLPGEEWSYSFMKRHSDKIKRKILLLDFGSVALPLWI